MSATASASQVEIALRHHERGELDQAERFYAQALILQPDNLQALHGSGVLSLQSGRYDVAIQRLRRAIDLGAGLAGTWFMLGRACKGYGELDNAIACYRRAVALDPAMTDAHVSLAIALRQKNLLIEAEEACRRALALQPEAFEALLSLGNIQQAQGLLETALATYLRAEAVRPRSTDLHHNIGVVLRGLGRTEEAIPYLQCAIELDAGFLDAYLTLANALNDMKQHAAAADCYEYLLRSIESDAGRPRDSEACRKLRQDARAGLAGALVWCHRYEEALPLLHAALEQHPNSIAVLEHLLVALPYRYSSRQQIGEVYARYQRITPLRSAPSLLPPVTTGTDRLRIGYVSGDFRDHSVTFFLEPILAHHDRRSFHVTCYSCNRSNDAVTDRLRGYADAWVEASGMEDRSLAQRIVDDGVEILVDLSGRTLGNRLGTFAHRPALLQVGYLGYPTYTGLHQIDFRVTDCVIDPVSADDRAWLAAELPLRLPCSMFCYRPPADVPALDSRSAAARPLCLGSFNQLQKISPAVLDAWVKILQLLPDTRLLLKAFAFSDPVARCRVLDVFTVAGISVERVSIRPGESDRRDHLALYGEVDIVLDTFPYNGATTTCEALWMGVPVVTLAGETHASRMGASILYSLGLEELVADSVDDYVAAVVTLAADTERLRRLQGDLRHRFAMSPLRDEAGFTRTFEQTLRDAWSARRAEIACALSPAVQS